MVRAGITRGRYRTAPWDHPTGYGERYRAVRGDGPEAVTFTAAGPIVPAPVTGGKLRRANDGHGSGEGDGPRRHWRCCGRALLA